MTKYLTVVFQHENGANLPAKLTAVFSGLNKEYEDCIIHDIMEGDAIKELSTIEDIFSNSPVDLDEFIGAHY